MLKTTLIKSYIKKILKNILPKYIFHKIDERDEYKSFYNKKKSQIQKDKKKL